MSVSAIIKLIFCILWVGPYIKIGWAASTLTLKACYKIKLRISNVWLDDTGSLAMYYSI